MHGKILKLEFRDAFDSDDLSNNRRLQMKMPFSCGIGMVDDWVEVTTESMATILDELNLPFVVDGPPPSTEHPPVRTSAEEAGQRSFAELNQSLVELNRQKAAAIKASIDREPQELEYAVVLDSSRNIVVSVRNWIERGWQPQGGISTFVQGDVVMLTQALTRPKPHEAPNVNS